MTLSDASAEAVCRAFGIPEAVVPWLDRFFDPPEYRLILALADGPLSAASLGERLPEIPADEQARFFDRAYRRGILNRRDDGLLDLADFHARYEIWALFEGWKDVPEPVRKALNEWEFEAFTEKQRPLVAALKRGESPEKGHILPRYVLLHEALDLLDRVAHIYLWPCNCRAMMGRCDRPSYTCIRFENDRDIGWEISPERAKEIIREANRKGLIQSAEIGLRPDGTITGAICNCCTDCCYPQQLAEQMETGRRWPLSRYVARHLLDRCTACGRCMRRCPYRAFTAELPASSSRPAPRRHEVRLNAAKCRGCGLCVETCPEDAIEMCPLPSRQPLFE